MPAAAPATLGLLLREFCHPDPEMHPGLAFPFYFPAGQGVVTMATDGVEVAIWAASRHGRFLDFQSGPTSDDFHPSEWRLKFRGGSSYPLPAKRPRTAPCRVMVFGVPALIPAPLAARLALWDTCHLGTPAGTRSGYHHEWLSLRLTHGKALFSGVIRCQLPA
jgi:hypothetical protein